MRRECLVPSAFLGESAHTAHLAVADGDIFSMAQTIRAAFGSRATVPGTGMLLYNALNTLNDHFHIPRLTVAASIN